MRNGISQHYVGTTLSFAIIKGIDIDYQAINQAKANAAISPWSDRISFEISDARTYRHSISPQNHMTPL